MRIDEIIILENNDAELRQELGQEFDDEYGNPKLPQFIMLDRASVVALAVGYYKRPLWTAGMSIKGAVKQRYPDFQVKYSGMTKDQAKAVATADKVKEPEDTLQQKIAKGMEKPDATPTPTGTVGGQIGNKNAYKGDGSFKNSKFNPLAGTDRSSLRKAIGSGLAKARSNFKNSDTFRVKKS